MVDDVYSTNIYYYIEPLKPKPSEVEEAYCEWEYPEEFEAAHEKFTKEITVEEPQKAKPTEIRFPIQPGEQQPQVTMKIEIPQAPEEGTLSVCPGMEMITLEKE